MAIKIALPKGRLLRKTAAMLQKADWGLDEYHSKIGFYRPRRRNSRTFLSGCSTRRISPSR